MPLDGALDLSGEIAELRRRLDPDAIEALRAVGAGPDAAMIEAAAGMEPGATEFDAAGALAGACRRRGLSSPVLLAAADERIALHRHPLPIGRRIERRAMLAVSAERGGLYANLIRIVEFEQPTAELARRRDACDEILARAREEATQPCRTLAEAFAEIQGFYRDAGFPEEWRLHDQGGLTGYASRELIATPASDHEIAPGQAFAWNSSITGAKAEETFVLTETGPQVVAGAIALAGAVA